MGQRTSGCDGEHCIQGDGERKVLRFGLKSSLRMTMNVQAIVIQ